VEVDEDLGALGREQVDARGATRTISFFRLSSRPTWIAAFADA